MNYGTIKKFDIANGLGVRVSLFISGCTHHCKGCFNAEAWDFQYGELFTEQTEQEILDALAHPFIQGLSLLGGEPFEIENQKVLVPFLRKVRQAFPQKDIWCYSGYTLETEILQGKVHTEVTDEFLSYLDVLVDGEFVEELKDISLPYRGSSNQRLIDIPQTLRSSQVILKEIKK